jgi:predicted metal-dependent HD superfamily phosphohydrolase
MPTATQWTATWNELGAAPPGGLYDELIARYAEPQRRYHTAQHLDECFAELAAVRAACARPAEVELALWFHDAIYDTKRNDNEERSAAWAKSVLASADVDADVGDRVAGLILATRHAATPAGTDAQVLVDVDLSILGAPPTRFDEYERQVREEYAWVPTAIFARKRREILEQLLARPRLYATARMHDAYEQRARANLARSLERLERAGRPRNLKRALGVAIVAAGLVGGFLESPTWFVFAIAGTVWLVYELARPQL